MHPDSLREGRRASDKARWAAIGLQLVLWAFLVWIHTVGLAEVPRGLYVDESSIGLNAATIAESGRDEFGVRYPTYFRAFGEYKNPVYVYAAALVFEIAGVSPRTLRLTSAAFVVLLLGGLCWLARRLVPDQPLVALWALAAGGVVPWLFAPSRVAFEVISQPAVVICVLCLVWAVYESERARRFLALLLGLAIGLSLYTYSTARLLTPLFLVILLAVYAARRYWQRHLLVVAGASVAAIPYLVFLYRHPGALTQRFAAITYVFDPALTLREKAATFCDSYLLFWSPGYLLLTGDVDRRSATGASGQVFWVILWLAVIGLVWGVRRRLQAPPRFVLLLGLNLLAAPIAASLTHGRSSLRSILVVVYLLLFSCLGLGVIVRIGKTWKRRALVIAIVLLLTVEAGRYLAHYFGPYVRVSAVAFESYDLLGALETALRQRPNRIDVQRRRRSRETHLEFYRHVLRPPPSLPIRSTRVRAEPGICVIYFDPATKLGGERFESRVWGAGNPTILRCFEPLPR